MGDGLVCRWLGFRRKQKEIEDKLVKALSESAGITLNEYYLLYFLDKADTKSMRLNDLEKVVGLSQSAISRMVSRLENRSCGVITRRLCIEDKRGIYIALTDKGKHMLEAGGEVVDGVLRDYFVDEE